MILAQDPNKGRLQRHWKGAKNPNYNSPEMTSHQGTKICFVSENTKKPFGLLATDTI